MLAPGKKWWGESVLGLSEKKNEIINEKDPIMRDYEGKRVKWGWGM